MTGESLILQKGQAAKNYVAGKGRKNMRPGNNVALQRTPKTFNSINHSNEASTSTWLLPKINTPANSLHAGVMSFVKDPISTDLANNIRLDSTYLKKLKAINEPASSKKHSIKSRGKTKDLHTKSTTGFDYGLHGMSPYL